MDDQKKRDDRLYLEKRSVESIVRTRFYRTSFLAKLSGISHKTIRRHIEIYFDLPASKISNYWHVLGAVFLEFLKKYKQL